MAKWILISLILIVLVYTKGESNNNNLSQDIKTKYFIFDAICFDKFHSQFILGPWSCYQYILSKIVGYLIVAFGSLLKVPQIILILKQGSVDGLLFFGITLQYLTTALATSFGIYQKLPFSVYGENISQAIQNAIICLLFLKYGSKKNIPKYLFVIILSGIISAIFILQMVPNYIQEVSIWVQLILFCFGRGSQLVANHVNKSTGALALSTIMIAFCGNLARIYTILMEASDQIGLLAVFVVSLLINGYILIQFRLYKGKKIKDQ